MNQKVQSSFGGGLILYDTHVEERIRALCEAEDWSAAAACAIESFGPEVLGWLVVTTNDPTTSEEAFSLACEDLWRGISAFRWECSARTWFYTLTRRALIRFRKRADENPKRRIALASFDAAERIRSGTAPWLRTDVKDVFARLRAQLSEEERELLVLRVDRDLSWEDIAIMLGENGDRATVNARLRKRFQLVRDKLRELASREGVLGGDT